MMKIAFLPKVAELLGLAAFLFFIGGFLAPTSVHADPFTNGGQPIGGTSSTSSSDARATDDGLPPCPGNEGQALSKGLRQGNASYGATRLAKVYSTGKTVLKGQAENPIEKARGDTTKCISGKIKDYFSAILSLLDGLEGFILDMIKSLILSILEKVCDLIVDAINSVLNMICIPLPSLSLPNMSLPGIEGKSCDGISLATFIKVEKGEGFDLTNKTPQSILNNALTLRPQTKTLFSY